MSEEGYTVQTTKTTTQPQEKPKSWNRRMAEHLKGIQDSAGLTLEDIELVFESAIEMHCHKLKILIARCYEAISTSNHEENQVCIEEGFEQVLLNAIK